MMEEQVVEKQETEERPTIYSEAAGLLDKTRLEELASLLLEGKASDLVGFIFGISESLSVHADSDFLKDVIDRKYVSYRSRKSEMTKLGIFRKGYDSFFEDAMARKVIDREALIKLAEGVIE